jgi:hypothetical protein
MHHFGARRHGELGSGVQVRPRSTTKRGKGGAVVNLFGETVVESAVRRQSVHFSSATVHWATPADLYRALDAEFHFTLDPCPLNGLGGLDRTWKGERVYCNPPWGATATTFGNYIHDSLK